MEIPRYMEYLKSDESIITKEGKSVQVFHLKIKDDLEIFEEWAKQFRRNYCSDSELKEMTRIMNITPSEYLKKINCHQVLDSVYQLCREILGKS